MCSSDLPKPLESFGGIKLFAYSELNFKKLAKMNVMSPEQQPQTIFRDVMMPDFVIKMNPDTQIQLDSIEKEDTFYMMLSTKSDKFSKFVLQLNHNRIFMTLGPGSPPVAYIDIDYSRIKLVKPTNILGKQLGSIRFIKGKSYEEIFHPEYGVLQDWFTSLKAYCILSKFRETYVVGRTIGKGNFAKVLACVKAQTKEEFAVKIFDKKLILKDKFERVKFINVAMPAL